MNVADHNDDNPLDMMVVRTGRRYHRFFPMVPELDVRQELATWCWHKGTLVNRWLEAGDLRVVQGALNNVASSFCRRERAQASGFSPDDEFFYTAGLLRELLPFVWDRHDSWVTPPAPDAGMPRRVAVLSEGNNWLTTLSDVHGGLYRLGEGDRYLLWQVYAEDQPVETLASVAGVEVPAMRKRVERALGRLVRVLGGERPVHDGPGSRRVMSNAEARARTDGAL